MTVYLACLDQPLGSDHPLGGAQHYLGQTMNLEQRLESHREGRGARILAAAVDRGIGFEVVRVWEGGREKEKALKALHNPRRLCPRHG